MIRGWIERVVVAVALGTLAGCTEKIETYFPDEPGLTWVYAVHTKNRREESHHRLVIENLKSTADGRRTILPQRRHDGSMAYYAIDARGVYRQQTTESTATPRRSAREEPVLAYPLRVGHGWRQTVGTALIPQAGCGICTTTGWVHESVRLRYRIVSTHAVADVQAGLFTDCIEVRATGHVSINAGTQIEPVNIRIDIAEWYAPGVGLVKRVWREQPDQVLFSPGELSMELNALL